MILCDTSTNLDQYRKKKDRKQLKTTILTPFIIDAAIMDRTEFAIDLLKNFTKKTDFGKEREYEVAQSGENVTDNGDDRTNSSVSKDVTTT